MTKKMKKIALSVALLLTGTLLSQIDYSRTEKLAKYYTHAVICRINTYQANTLEKQSNQLLNSIHKKKFLHKIENPVVPWMSQRIDKELALFRNKKISQQALEATHKQILGSGYPVQRLRIIDNVLYHHTGVKYDIGNDPLVTLLKLIHICKLPGISHIDLILSYTDGMPTNFAPNNYWITANLMDQAPILTPAKLDSAPYLICMPDRLTTSEWSDLAQKIQLGNKLHPWDKKVKKCFWRGGQGDFPALPTDSAEALHQACRNSPRFILCSLAMQQPNLIDAAFHKSDVNSALEDIIQPLCKPPVTKTQHIAYAYLPTLDGAMCTYPGYLWRLLSNSVVFKQETGTSQWFYDALKPFEHYIPLRKDMGDVMERIEWARKHDEECKRISRNARHFVRNNLMIEDIYTYFYVLLKEYTSCQNFDRQALIDDTIGNASWIKMVAIE